MAKLPTSLSAKRYSFKPWHYVLVAMLIQVAMFVCFRWAQNSSANNPQHEELEFAAFVIGGLLSVLLVSLLAWQQHQRFNSEDRVRQRLLDVIDALPDPAAVRDQQGRYALWNKAAEQYHGIAAKFVVGKTPFDLFPQEVAKSITLLDKETMRSDSVVVQRLNLPPLYGRGKRIGLMRCAPIHSLSEPDIVRGVVAIMHDVTAEEEEAMALRYTAAQLKMALDTSGFGSWIWDLEHDVVTYSPQYEKLLRYTGTEFRKDYQFESRVHPEDVEQLRQAARASIKQNLAFSHTYRIECFDGRYRSFHASGEPALDQHGRRVFAGLLCPLDRSDI